MAATFTLLPITKGAIVGLQWALYMHGFELAAKVKGDPSSSAGAIKSGEAAA